MAGTPADLAALEKQKAKVVQLKKDKAPKDSITAAVAELKRLKELCGDVAAEGAKDKKAKGPAEQPRAEGDGPSKKAMKKMAKAQASGKEIKVKKGPSQAKDKSADAGAGEAEAATLGEPAAGLMCDEILGCMLFSAPLSGAVGAAPTSKRQLAKAAKAAAAATAAPEVIPVDNTKPGEKKDTSKAIQDKYYPSYVEAAWDSWWTAKGFFKPEDPKPGQEKFVMVIPPPNVTGSLHLGHALTVAVEDCLTRWHRMQGHATLWLPGLDHAGIATQVVVEKKLKKERGILRHDIGREKFVEEVWKWKEDFGNKIFKQLRSVGVSVDWSRQRFTMDPLLGKAVTEAFVRMSDKGVIYRGTRLVNWSCALRSAISDLEVDHMELTGKTMLKVPGHDQNKQYAFGVITSFAYKIKDFPGEELVVATTRLETMLGDTAVAVHPKDPRYTKYHGKTLIHPFFPDRHIPVITDDVLVNMEFGTGCVKITPAHDPNDYQCGKRHKLEFINLLTKEGLMNDNCGEFKDLLRYDAREAIEKALKAKDLYRGEADNPMSIGTCQRSKDIVEPYLVPQWWADCKNMAKRSADAVRNGDLKLTPASHEKTWFHYLDNIQDWCISRQLWWGHRIPAYKITAKGAKPDFNTESGWIVGRSLEEATERACKETGKKESEIELHQDPDVLDTWFSSGLFPFSVMSWPDNSTGDLEKFFPGQLLETGHDILFFWVARMVMMSLELCDVLPFKQVYLHAMVRDAHGRKMSKSLGNVIDPTWVIEGIKLSKMQEAVESGNLDPKEVVKAKEGQQQDYGKTDGIPECGSDALRFGLLAYTSQGRDVNLDVSRVVGYRHLCNKVWQANKLFHNFVGDWKPPASPPDVSKASFAVQYLLHRTHLACTEVHDLLGKFDFSAATTTIYNFWWYVLCDTFIELSKPALYGTDMAVRDVTLYAYYAALHFGLRMSHPFLPFMTEELYQHLPRHSEDREALCIERYPSTGFPAWKKDQLDEDWKAVDAAVHSVRSLYSSYGIIKKPVPPVYLKALDKNTEKLLNVYADPIKTLLVSEGCIVLSPTDKPPKGSAAEVVNSKVTAYVVVAGMIDLEKEVAKQEKKVGEIKAKIANMNFKLSQPQYAQKSPAHVQKADAEKLEDLKKELATAESAKKSMENLQSGVEDTEPAAPAGGDDDDEFDLFGSDDEDDAELEARVKAAQEKIDAKNQVKGKVLIAKSALTLDVKPWEADTDMKKLEACVRTVTMEGLLWGKSKLVDVAFGVKKLQINAVIEDEKVSTDDLQDQIEAFEDYVQSMDVVAFQKI